VNTNPYTVGRLVGMARESRGLTVPQLAKLCDLSASTIRNVEAGTMPEPWIRGVVEAVAAAMNYPVRFFWREIAAEFFAEMDRQNAMWRKRIGAKPCDNRSVPHD
jgi:transcriptional regulator with XRE-family HTH domain